MLKTAVHVAAVSLVLAGSALAADMRAPAYKAPVAAPAVAYNWTGCYLGAGGGYGMYDQTSQYLFTGIPLGSTVDNGGRGWFGTVQVGCDYQVGSNLVIGAFADYDFSGFKGDVSTAALGWVGSQKLKSSWAAGGRIGWLPFQQLLVFVSGGYVETRADQVNLFTTTGIDTGFALEKHTYTGWFIGSGYEYGIGWLPGLFWKTEYRFADYGSDRVPILSGGIPGGSFIGSHLYLHTVRSELVWRFNMGGPVVARY